ncbi:hypothetical protein C3L50_06950 [Flavobacterium alvei]|uniref:Uncharacterized protein n=2 Tax=Flavobacterium alvei TaxID=2080416 RepID=A0A2S5ACW0_9FLAO|nr:hypothetical protein C3L50_06950 [Flavobacterium alvei]
MVIFIIILLVVIVYIYKFNNRDRNLDYKYSPEFKNLSNVDKMLIEIINGLEASIKQDVLNKFADDYTKIVAITSIINQRETSFLNSINEIANQENISVALAKKVINTACNTVRMTYGLDTKDY